MTMSSSGVMPPPRMSAFRARGEHERAQPFHDRQAEHRVVDEVVERQRELRAPRRHVAVGEAGEIVRRHRKARALEHGGDLAREHRALVLGHAEGSGKWCTTPLKSAPSKLASGNGSRSMSPATNSIRGCLRRPTATSLAEMSSPTQSKPARASSAVNVPEPQPRSITRAPGGSFVSLTNASMRRALDCGVNT